MRIAVTGASGFIGQTLCPMLRARGHAVVALDRAATGDLVPDLSLTVLRPPLVYGPGVKANFLFLLRAVACGWPLPLASIENRRSLVYVGNLADAVIRCVESPQAVGKTYGVTDGAPLSTAALCCALGTALDSPSRLFPCPPVILDLLPSGRKLTRSLVIDDSAIRGELGWAPPHTFEAGLRLTAGWFLSRGG